MSKVLEHFHITPEQCGLSVPHQNNLSEAQSYVLEDYTTMQATWTYQERESKQSRSLVVTVALLSAILTEYVPGTSWC